MKSLLKIFCLLLFIVLVNASVYAAAVTTKVIISGGYPNLVIKKAVEKNISQLLNVIGNGYDNGEEVLSFNVAYATEGATNSINDIWKGAKFYCTQQEIKELLIKTNSGYQVRNIQVSVDNEAQEIVVDLDKKGLITDLYFSLSMNQYQNVMESNSVIDKTRREIILNFMEMLKTSYMRKDINFIDDVFSDKALIIVGKKVQKTEKENLKLINSDKETFYRQSGNGTEYKKMTKAEYLEGLKRVFANNRSIQLRFEDIEVEQHAKKGYESFYGVRLKQDWKSDSYKDYGILFFLIQFRENESPLIWVRTWQDANTTDKSEQIGFGDFKIRPE